MKCKLNPLQNKEVIQKERFLGWYVDGEWKVDNQELSFLNYNPKSFLLTNNLVLDSPILKFEINFNFQRASEENLKPGMQRLKDEGIAISFSPFLYPIKSYDEKSTHNIVQGLTFMLISRNDKNYMFVREFQEPSKFDLKRAKSLSFQKDETKYCQLNYENKNLQLVFVLDFEKGFLSAYADDMLCITYRFNQDNYPQSKAAITMQGYSGRSNPCKITLNEMKITKKVFLNTYAKSAFVDDAVSFSRSVENFNRSLTPEQQKSNLLNIMKEQGRIDKGLQNTANIVDLIAVRSNALEEMIQKIYNIKKDQDQDNMYYANKKFEQSLEDTTKSLEKMIDFNANVFQEFADFYKDFQNIQKLFDSMNQFDKIINHVQKLDEIMLVNEYEDYLTQLSNVQNEDQSDKNQQEFNNEIDDILKEFGLGSGFTVLSCVIVISIFVMICLILRKAKNLNKTVF